MILEIFVSHRLITIVYYNINTSVFMLLSICISKLHLWMNKISQNHELSRSIKHLKFRSLDIHNCSPSAKLRRQMNDIFIIDNSRIASFLSVFSCKCAICMIKWFTAWHETYVCISTIIKNSWSIRTNTSKPENKETDNLLLPISRSFNWLPLFT